jgi:hypothetical protein
MLGTLRWKGMHSPEELAKKLEFTSAEEMRGQLEEWKLPGWLIGAEPNPTKNRGQKKSALHLRNLAPGTVLPSAGNASELFKERLEELLKSTELLEHMDESLHGRFFVRQDVDTGAMLVSRLRTPARK